MALGTLGDIIVQLSELLLLLLEPWAFIFYSITHIPLTIRGLLAAGQYSTLCSPSAFREALFGFLWATIGPNVKQNGEKHVIPLIEGKVSGGRVHKEVVGVPLHGNVLEVGAGSGLWADVFARLAATNTIADDDFSSNLRNRKNNTGGGGGITKIYGVEPNPISAAALRKRVKELGIQDMYEVVPVGIEAVDDATAWEGTIEPGSIDCIVGVLCLCSIPEPEKNIKLLYRLLKPGGYWYVYEHVKVKRGGPPLRLYQRKHTLPPPFMFLSSQKIGVFVD